MIGGLADLRLPGAALATHRHREGGAAQVHPIATAVQVGVEVRPGRLGERRTVGRDQDVESGRIKTGQPFDVEVRDPEAVQGSAELRWVDGDPVDRWEVALTEQCDAGCGAPARAGPTLEVGVERARHHPGSSRGAQRAHESAAVDHGRLP